MLPLETQAQKLFGFTSKDEVESMRIELSQLKATKTEEAPKVEVTKEDVKLAQIEVNEGTVLYFDGDISDGTAIFSDEAQEVPAEDGDYTVDGSGDTFSIASGEVTGFTPAEGETEATEEAPAEETTEEEVAAQTPEIEGLMERVAQLEILVQQLVEQFSTETVEMSNKTSKLSEENAALTTKNDELEASNVKLSKASSVEPTKSVPTTKSTKSAFESDLLNSKDLF